jgi:ribulose-bisphosphate carboxylase large chain
MMSIYGNLDFVDRHYKPKSSEVVLDYLVTPIKSTKLERAAEYIAGESSIGTWTKIQTMNPVIAKTLKPTVFHISNKTGEVKIAYPELLFEPGNMPGLLSSIAGNIYGMKELAQLRFEDISFTKSLVQSFPGPQFGIEGIRKLTGVKDRPLLGTIVKPKVGLTSEQHAAVAYDAWTGGLDIVKDDENLCSMTFNTFEKRIRLTLAARDKAEKITGEKKIYLANITAETDEMKRRALIVKRYGGEFIMIDILTVGWAAVQTMRTFCEKHKLAIHAHRAMHGALTRLERHGMSMAVIAKIARLIGVDQLHIGTASIGKMDGDPDEALALERLIESDEMEAEKSLHLLHQEWHGIKPVLAVASGGLSPLSIPKVAGLMGIDIVMQFGGGCHGHPDGTYAGACAIRQAWEATAQGISLKEYAKTHAQLDRALEKWSVSSKKKTSVQRSNKKKITQTKRTRGGKKLGKKVKAEKVAKKVTKKKATKKKFVKKKAVKKKVVKKKVAKKVAKRVTKKPNAVKKRTKKSNTSVKRKKR